MLARLDWEREPRQVRPLSPPTLSEAPENCSGAFALGMEGTRFGACTIRNMNSRLNDSL
jgi:hypothetical protein